MESTAPASPMNNQVVPRLKKSLMSIRNCVDAGMGTFMPSKIDMNFGNITLTKKR
jgi:hypothetical protein